MIKLNVFLNRQIAVPNPSTGKVTATRTDFFSYFSATLHVIGDKPFKLLFFFVYLLLLVCLLVLGTF